MSARALVVVQRLALLAALLASAALIIDYQNIGDPTFCGVESPCYKVRASDIGRQLATLASKVNLSVPAIGLLAHLGLLAATFAARTRATVRGVAALAVLGGVCAVGLLVVQLQLGEICPWCTIVDLSAITVAVTSLLLARGTPDEAGAAWAREASGGNLVLAWSAGAALVVALPFLWAANPQAAPRPASIEALQEPGKLTVVSFTDFECPHCRNLAPTLDELKKDPRVVFKRMMAPLDFHLGAKPAALGYLCVAEERREEMAKALYGAKATELNAAGVALLAEKVGETDQKAFAACVKSEATQAHLEADMQAFASAGGTGLPTTWVGRRVVKGARVDALTRAFASEADGSGLSLPIWAMFVAASAVGLFVAGFHLRTLRRSPAPAEAESDAAAQRDEEAAPPKRGAKKSKSAVRGPAKTAAATPRALRDEEASAAPSPGEGPLPKEDDAT